MSGRIVVTTAPARPEPDRRTRTASRRAHEAAAALGVSLDALAGRPASGPAAPTRLVWTLDRGEVQAVVGPSGAGKSSLLGALARAARAGGWAVARAEDRPAAPRRRCIDLVGRDAPSAMARLAGVGLGDLRAMLRRPPELSDGQRSRLHVALAIEALAPAPPGRRLLIIDEFAASLDDEAARAHAVALRRIVARIGAAVVVATHREDLLGRLGVGRVVRLDAFGRASVERRSARRRNVAIEIREGARLDYAALSPLHYRPNPPATIERVLAAASRASGRTIGVLTVSRPVLNASWRDLAWPGRYLAPSGAARADRLNREVRTITRVIVDPAFRGLGVARRLVRAYLRDPLTPATEALAALGLACPFFERAGMTAYRVPTGLRNARLLDLLEQAGVPRWMLGSPERAFDRAACAVGEASLTRELRGWAAGARRRDGETARERFARACLVAASTPVAYAHTAR